MSSLTWSATCSTAVVAAASTRRPNVDLPSLNKAELRSSTASPTVTANTYTFLAFPKWRMMPVASSTIGGSLSMVCVSGS